MGARQDLLGDIDELEDILAQVENTAKIDEMGEPDTSFHEMLEEEVAALEQHDSDDSVSYASDDEICKFITYIFLVKECLLLRGFSDV